MDNNIRPVVQLDHLVVQINQQLYSTASVELLTGERSVSRHEEASADDGSVAGQGGLIGKHIWAICVGRTTCCAISTNSPSGWFYQDDRWSLIN